MRFFFSSFHLLSGVRLIEQMTEQQQLFVFFFVCLFFIIILCIRLLAVTDLFFVYFVVFFFFAVCCCSNLSKRRTECDVREIELFHVTDQSAIIIIMKKKKKKNSRRNMLLIVFSHSFLVHSLAHCNTHWFSSFVNLFFSTSFPFSFLWLFFLYILNVGYTHIYITTTYVLLLNFFLRLLLHLLDRNTFWLLLLLLRFTF